jgi:hypothetical protein
LQAFKANPEGAVKELKLNANYITRFGQVRGTVRRGRRVGRRGRGGCVCDRGARWRGQPRRPSRPPYATAQQPVRLVQVALGEAVDMVYEMAKGRTMSVQF